MGEPYRGYDDENDPTGYIRTEIRMLSDEQEPEEMTPEEIVSEAFRQIHNQSLRRTYTVAEVKQIVYPLVEAIRALEKRDE